MFKNILFTICIACLITACGSQTAQSNAANPNQFGEAINQKGTISYDDLLKKLSNVDSLNTKVTGTVNEVCQAKGCWMTIVDDQSGTEMRVKFKDYAFFVPKDISGKKVVFEGKAYKEITSIDELRHYAEDAGKSKEEIAAITSPEESYKFMASGVLLLDK